MSLDDYRIHDEHERPRRSQARIFVYGVCAVLGLGAAFTTSRLLGSRENLPATALVAISSRINAPTPRLPNPLPRLTSPALQPSPAVQPVWLGRPNAPRYGVSPLRAADADQIDKEASAGAELKDGVVVNKEPPKREEGLAIIGSRRSQLAMVQSEWVRDVLTSKFASEEKKFVIYEVVSKGDMILDVPLSQVGGMGLFTKELEVSLLNNEIDLAVHSLKDCETKLPDGLFLAAISEREDPSDILVPNPTRPEIVKCKTIKDLPQGAVVGTSSLRRMAQIKAMRPDLVIKDVRGNVQSRLAKLEKSYDVIIMAKAGFQRLGLFDGPNPVVAYDIDSSEMLHAVGQGALAVECRKDDKDIVDQVKSVVEHPATRARVEAERGFLRFVGGGCQVPLGVSSEVKGNTLKLIGGIFSLDGSESYRAEVEGPVEEAEQLGKKVADIIIEKGGGELIKTLARGDHVAK